MLIGKELIKPDPAKKPEYCVGEKEPKKFLFNCCECNNALSINFQTQINSGWDGKTKNITYEEVQILKNHYALGENSNAHGNGFPTFDLLTCKKCKTKYYTYTGVDEWKYGAYAVYIQGVIKKNAV